MSYTTLDRVKAELKGTEAVKPSGTDQLLMGYIQTVTMRIKAFGLDFEPQYDTKYFTPSPMIVSSFGNRLTLTDDKMTQYLLAPNSIIISGVTKTFGTDIIGYPRNYTPYRSLSFNPTITSNCDTWYPTSSNQYRDSIVITGWWGYRERYDVEGWLDNSKTCTGALTTTTTTITTQNVGGADLFGRTPCFSAGNLIKIDNELMLILSMDTTLNTLLVRRGMNGTTPAAHNGGSTILVWECEDDIVRVATRQAGLLYARRGAYEQVLISDVATATYPKDLLAELYDVVSSYGWRS